MTFCPSYNLPKIKTKIKPRPIYPKKLNSEARLRNGKVLGTYSVLTESGLLDYHDRCTPFMHDMNDLLPSWKTKSHKSIYECIIFFIKKISDLCCDKKDLIWFRKIKSIFVHLKKKKVFGIEKSDLCLLNKTKSFGFKKISDLFLRTRKIGFWFVLKKSDLFYNKKI